MLAHTVPYWNTIYYLLIGLENWNLKVGYSQCRMSRHIYSTHGTRYVLHRRLSLWCPQASIDFPEPHIATEYRRPVDPVNFAQPNDILPLLQLLALGPKLRTNPSTQDILSLHPPISTKLKASGHIDYDHGYK